jgi:PadR family transcriptional regulator PadR
MADRAPTTTVPASGASRFEFAPPRRFVLPAVLLLLSERPSYGYNLEKDLLDFNVGRIDRPTVYRALADLEADGLVASWTEAPTAGQARRVYGVTPLGERVLRVWMHVIKEERDCLGSVLRRYQATGTVDAVLAEVDGGWAAALGFGWSPVSATSATPRRLGPVDGDWRYVTPDAGVPSVAPDDADRVATGAVDGAHPTAERELAAGDAHPAAERELAGGEAADSQPTGARAPSGAIGGGTAGARHPADGDAAAGARHPGATTAGVAGVAGAAGPGRFRLVPDRSVVLIDVRSTVGPISFGADGLSGTVVADIADGAIRAGSQPAAHIEIAVEGLRSGNGVYDAELLRRIDARRFPVATLDLRDCLALGSTGRYRLAGELTFHGVTRPADGTVGVTVAADGRLVVTGDQVLDIRDFAVPSPTVLMLRIYPDVRVHLHLEAEREEG